VEIAITESEGLRQMRFGTAWCQGAMHIDDPDRLELAYAVRMSAWLLFHEPDGLAGKDLVTLGLGAGSLTKFACRVLGMRTTAVEIDHRVIEACRTHFLLPPDSDRLRVVHADAADAAVEKPALDTEAFYANCRRCLRDGGTLAVNLIGRGFEARDSVARIRAALRPRTVWQFPPTDAGNVVVIAHCGELPPDALLARRAIEIERRWDLPASDWLGMARQTVATVPEVT
jgi:spermidine synthase